MALSCSFSRSACAARAPQTRRSVQIARRVSVHAEAQVKVSAGQVTDDTWEAKVLQCTTPVLVDFWAPWCGPCRMIAPLIDEIANDHAGKLVCLKLNTDESPGVAAEYGIRSIPTVMVFKGGKKVETIIGAVPKSTMEQAITKYL